MKHYVGRASNVRDRLEWHNQAPCGYTVRYRPWSIVVSIDFPDEALAVRFEKYLKSGSGRAFAKRHFAESGGVCETSSHSENRTRESDGR